MATEIARCFRCGGIMQEMCFGVGTQYIHCPTCLYASVAKPTIEEAIAAHNALCADVELARNLRKVFAVVQYVEIGANPPKGVICARVNVFDPIEGDTLDAALAQLAEKIQGDTNGRE